MAGLRIRVVDAFTDSPFAGNPAAVVVLEEWPSEEWMRLLAREMQLSETAFVVPEPDGANRLRWFTPTVEVNLCGHATLASAHCLFEDGAREPIRFLTRSGELSVDRRADGRLRMDFPASPPSPIDVHPGLEDALGASAVWVGESSIRQTLVVLAEEKAVRQLTPTIDAVAGVGSDAVIVTAKADPGRGYDFASRVFAPNLGIAEDPVTGSAHTVLGPYWSRELGRDSLVGLQASARSGVVGVELADDRVLVSGHAITVWDGALRSAPVT